VVDKDGTPDNNEQYWIGCGDIEGRAHSRAVYNEVINSKLDHLQEFIDLGRAVTDKFLAIISAILGLGPENKDYLPKLHSHSNNSGSHVRLLKCPPKPENANVSLQPQYVAFPEMAIAFVDSGSHTHLETPIPYIPTLKKDAQLTHPT
jgi:hypothetical protein